ncbi:glycosyltransferase family 2 protein [Winogradskyella sp. R77965]|uniref:glycosyltransferase family 2 protein n=1 Tax=Winogradskyella sp. R77965 TaxID=3093872 RepID=UPI0037DC0686
MLSILIPTYNYNVTELLNTLKAELGSIAPNYEVICYEDGSSKYLEENKTIIQSITNAKHIISADNKGRITTRQSLAENAKYNWLLFLDSDVIPEKVNFLKDYLKFLNHNYDVIYGGFTYDSKKPNKQFTLRWKYGKKYEHVNADVRNKTPYKIVISGNFLVKKRTFLDINSRIENDGYGYDNYMGALMKANNIKVFHINNNVIHKGLDTNSIFLTKVNQAVETIFEINQKHSNIITDNSLLELYKKIKSFGLKGLILFIFKISKTSIKRQLLSGNPNLTFLQFYKLGYLCSITSGKT